MRHGIIHDVIPAEAHHRLGKIERRNALLRSIVERFVDEGGVSTQDELSQCLVAATFTMNSCTYSHGQHTASSHIKRALLRKTRHQVDLRSLQPGQPVAFWRWSGHSRQHKKGAWALARFVSVDPDGKSAWIQINNTTTKVAGNQVRTAVGWEEWCPSAEDIKILKDAEVNLRDNLWDDKREEPPGDREEVSRELAAMVPAPLPEPDRDYWRLDR